MSLKRSSLHTTQQLPDGLIEQLPVDVPDRDIQGSENDDFPSTAIRVDQRIPDMLPQPFGVSDLLSDEQTTEVSVTVTDGCLDHSGRNAKDFGKADDSCIRVDSQAGQRFDTPFIGVDSRPITDDKGFEPSNLHHDADPTAIAAWLYASPQMSRIISQDFIPRRFTGFDWHEN
jgi:hypothetical protein